MTPAPQYPNKYNCLTCENFKDDCDESDSIAVSDVSKRCGLTCHSDFVNRIRVGSAETIRILRDIESIIVYRGTSGCGIYIDRYITKKIRQQTKEHP